MCTCQLFYPYFLCISVFVFIYTDTHDYIHIQTHVCTYVQICKHIYIHMYLKVCDTYIYIHKYVIYTCIHEYESIQTSKDKHAIFAQCYPSRAASLGKLEVAHQAVSDDNGHIAVLQRPPPGRAIRS